MYPKQTIPVAEIDGIIFGRCSFGRRSALKPYSFVDSVCWNRADLELPQSCNNTRCLSDFVFPVVSESFKQE